MTLRRKTLFNIIYIFASLILIVFFVSRYIILENLKKVEEDTTRQNIERIKNTLSYKLSELEFTTSDWASWDDTYEFIEDSNEDYIETNLVDETFSALQLNLVLFYNSYSQMVYAKAYDILNDEETPVPEQLLKHLSANNKVLNRADMYEVISGLICLPDSTPLLVASLPILTSEDEGPVRGTLIFGRYLDSTQVDNIGQLTRLAIKSYSLTDDKLPAEISAISLSSWQENPAQILLASEQSIAGYTLIEDIYGNPGLIFEINMPRDIYRQGRLGIFYLVITLTGVGIISCIIAMLLADKQGLLRLRNLVGAVDKIKTSGDLSERIETKDNDEITRLTESINDMLATIQKNYEKEVQLRSSLEVEIKRRADYTRALVHELKTPLTPLLTSSDILTTELTQEPYSRLAKNINRGAIRLTNRIDELLDLARGEIGTLKLALTQIDPLQLLKDITDEFTPEAASHKITLITQLPPSLPQIRGDEERLRQVISNLLNNACRYTPGSGSIIINAKEKDNSLVVEVQDSGSGITEEDKDNIFLPYYRSEKDKQNFSGLGLGLALCKILVELHGGIIWVQSIPGKGSTFGFSIPYK